MQVSQLSRFALVLGIITVLSALCPAPAGHNEEISSERAMSTVEIKNDLDAEINDDEDDTNFGSNAKMRVGRSPDPPTMVHRTIMEFDVSESNIPDGATINSAKLTVVAYAIEGDFAVLVGWVRRVTQAGWVEAEVTWNDYSTGNAWTTPGGDYDSQLEVGWIINPTVGQPFDITGLKELVKDAIENRSDRLIIILMRKVETGCEGWTGLNSSDAPQADRPKLVVDYTQQP